MENIAEKKKAIFDSTLELIREHGFHGTPMSMVAKNANVAAGTIYHYFESKDQLICELFTYNERAIIEVINKALTGGRTYKEKFYCLWCNLYQFYIENPNVLVFFEQYLNSPYHIRRRPNYPRGVFFDFLSELRDKEQVRDIKPEILMVLFFGSITSAAKLHVSGRTLLSQADLEQVIDALWKGIAAHSS